MPATVSRRAGMIHGFLFFPGLVRAADAALDEACAWLRGAFADRGDGGGAENSVLAAAPAA